ncbi:hypothetical protein EIP91_002822 [Steccherinum ochraceum]|uniref:Glucose-methanol-choline oxidoreductase N-terminal domain-containing protein n=1 Tax=Steccherinum ochraceum TaxID=92696 RepID=A0A4V2MWA9_9APHY|nr:hypothetical protein EIP91_002822 [Steccherinum ochraceum]
MTAKLADVEDKSFDYIIVGGGTAGLTLAAKLSEDPNRTVLVLEAGPENTNDPLLLRLASFGVHFGNDQYSWSHQTVSQKHASGNPVPWFRLVSHSDPSGKGLGGTSGVNFYGWGKPHADDINDFERLGNPGWNWDRLNGHIRALEGFVSPKVGTVPEEQVKHTEQLGTRGPLKLGFPPEINPVDIAVYEARAMINVGFPRSVNPYGGDPRGVWLGPSAIDPKTHTRTYAASAFYLPNKGRANLTVLVEAYVTRVVTESQKTGNWKATGVEFVNHGRKCVVSAAREVILCAGAMKSPQILELSGIGSSEVLNKIGVPVKVDLPVGENVQDHPLAAITLELKVDPALETFDMLREPEIAAKHAELVKSGKGLYTQSVDGPYCYTTLSAISPNAERIQRSAEDAIRKKLHACSPGRRLQYEEQLERLKTGRAGIEILGFPIDVSFSTPIPGKKYVTLCAGQFHAFSRGTIHSATNNPLDPPEYDPNYFGEDVDLQILVQGAHFLRKLASTSPLKELVVAEAHPGPAVEPGNDEQMRAYVRKTAGIPPHTSSSCSMLPRDQGGVVDASLKVYGTDNLRVVDLSIVPINFATHPQAVVYGIASLAAEIITSENAV